MIQIYCRYFGYQGEQQHGHSFTDALSQYYPLGLHSWDPAPPASKCSLLSNQLLDNATATNPHGLSIGIGPIAKMDTLEGSYKIAFTVWETSLIPTEKIRPLEDIDEIWVPSAWGKKLFEENGINGNSINIVAEGVDSDVYKPASSSLAHREDAPYRFLCVGKWEVRKGMDRLLQAWSRAFAPGDNVELILHCHNPFIAGFDLKAILKQAAIKSAPIILSDPLQSTADMVALYNHCDAFVLPTRAEGWGLPIIEAMSCAKPVIVTDYSAHTEYANHENAYLIGVKRMMNVRDPYFFDDMLDFGQWADPDVDHLIELLRYVVQNPDEAQLKGKNARQDISHNWTWEHAAQKAVKCIEANIFIDKHQLVTG